MKVRHWKRLLKKFFRTESHSTLGTRHSVLPLRLIALIGVIVPRRLRHDWRQEWEAELHWREGVLAEWDGLNWKAKCDLLFHSLGAFWDALWMQSQRWEDDMIQDVRFGLRMLIKRPALTTVIIISLGLGIGANATIFSFVNALLLRPPDVAAPSELREIWNARQNEGSAFERYLPLSYPEYTHYRDQNKVFSDLIAYDETSMVNWSRGGQAEIGQLQAVSGNFFSGLGVTTAVGRTFLPDEDRLPGQSPVVVLSHLFWQQHLGGDQSIIGTPLTLNGQSFTIIGVAQSSFTGTMAGIAPAFWVPLMMKPQLDYDPQALTRRDSLWLTMVGRLKPGIDTTTAQADLSLLAEQLRQAYPKNNKDLDVALFPATMIPGPFRGFVGAFTGVLMAIVAMVLMIACANAANLLLAQANSRRQEMAIRTALGAGRWRLIRQSLTESVVLSCLSGAAGLALAYWSVPILLKLAPPTLPIKFTIPMDYTVLGFILLVSVLTGIIFGLAPALRGAKLNLIPSLKDGSYGKSYHRSRFRNVLLISQVTVCVVLLIAGGLCLRSLSHAQSIDIGFETKDRLAAILNLRTLNYSEERGKAFFSSLLENIRSLPGVQRVSIANYLQLGMVSSGRGINVEGFEPPTGQSAFMVNTMDVGPGYFQTMGVPLLGGREFDQRDREGAPPVAIINEAMAKRFWPGQDPVGHRFILGAVANGKSHEIIAVVKTGKYRSLSEDARPFFYLSFLQSYHPKATVIAQTSGDPEKLIAAVRGEVQRLDPHLALNGIETLRKQLGLALFPAEATGILLGVFGLLGLVLALVGLSGAIAYSVSQRTREIGVRMALGAQRRDVLQLVLKQGMWLTFIGLGIGLIVSFALTRFLSSLLYGVSATDPVTFIGVSLLLSVVALLACYFPARRATKVDPLVALRCD
jgi:predicted permease